MLRAPGCCNESVLFPALKNLNAVYFLTACCQISSPPPPQNFTQIPFHMTVIKKTLRTGEYWTDSHAALLQKPVSQGGYHWKQSMFSVLSYQGSLKQCSSCRKVTTITTCCLEHQELHWNSDQLMFILTLLSIICMYLLWDIFQHII